MQISLSRSSQIVLIAVFSMLLYATTLHNGFVYDDTYTIVNNRFIKSLNNLPRLVSKDYFILSSETTYRPIVTITYFIDYAAYGLRPWGFHLTNILIHAANGVLLYIFLALLFNTSESRNQHLEAGTFKPLIISLLFAANPVLSEAVNAISFREDLLAFFFYMATLILYIKLRSDIIQRPNFLIAIYILSCFSYFFALLSKEMAATLPLIVWCYEWIYGDKKKRGHSFLHNRYFTGYIAVTLIYIYIRFFYFQSPDEGFVYSWSLMERILTLPWVIVNDIKLAIFPVSLSAEYNITPIKSILSPLLITSAGALLCLLVLAIKKKKGERIFSFGIIFFIVTLIPVFNIIPIYYPLADRYLYLPSVGLAVFLGSYINKGLLQSPKTLTHNPYFLVLFFIVAICSLLSGQRNLIWQDEYSLWSDAVKKMPNSSRAHNGLGLSYAREGMLDEAVNEYLIALKINPDNTNALLNLGVVYTVQGKLDDAILQYETVLNLNPKKFDAYSNLGYIYRKQGRFEDAVISYEAALRWKPDDIKARYNLGLIYISMGSLKKGRAELETALKTVPEFLPARQALESLDKTDYKKQL